MEIQRMIVRWLFVTGSIKVQKIYTNYARPILGKFYFVFSIV